VHLFTQIWKVLLLLCCAWRRSQIEELSLRCQATTQLRVLFGEVWLVQTTHVKLKGSVPHDREYNALAATAGALARAAVL
jgi:hypothetical protein